MMEHPTQKYAEMPEHGSNGSDNSKITEPKIYIYEAHMSLFKKCQRRIEITESERESDTKQ